MSCSEGSARDKCSAELVTGEKGSLGCLWLPELDLNCLEFECVGVFLLTPSLFSWFSLNKS